jgi:hypothetical protein
MMEGESDYDEETAKECRRSWHKRQLPSCLASNDTGSGTMHAAGVLEDVVLLFGFCE